MRVLSPGCCSLSGAIKRHCEQGRREDPRRAAAFIGVLESLALESSIVRAQDRGDWRLESTRQKSLSRLKSNQNMVTGEDSNSRDFFDSFVTLRSWTRVLPTELPAAEGLLKRTFLPEA